MSYHFGEALSFYANHRPTDKVNLINKKDFSYVNEGKTLIKKTCLQDELFDPKSEDIIETTGSTTVYFASGSLSVTSAIATTHLKEYKERLLQTWMPVNAKVKHEDVSNKYLIQRDLFVNYVSTRDVNILHYILNIKEFREETKMKVTISNDKEHKRHYATLSSVIKNWHC